jgi:hypothetical protein
MIARAFNGGRYLLAPYLRLRDSADTDPPPEEPQSPERKPHRDPQRQAGIHPAEIAELATTVLRQTVRVPRRRETTKALLRGP